MDTDTSRRRFIQGTLAAGMLGIGGMLAGCMSLGGREEKQSTDGTRILRLSDTFSEQSLDPLRSSWLPRWIGLHECLLQIDNSDLKLSPSLATSWRSDDGGRSWRFKLRQNVSFHDGTPLDAKAAQESLHRAFTNQMSGLTSVPVASITAESEYVLRIDLDSPFVPLPAYVAHNAAAIVSPKELKNGKLTAPIFTGPFKVMSWNPQMSLTAVRNENYYGTLPDIDQIEYEVVPDGQTREFKLLAGELNMIWNQPISSVNAFKQDSDTNVHYQQVTQARALAFNTDSSPFEEQAVRQAAAYALNGAANVKNVLRDVGEVGIGPWPPWVYWANNNLEPYDHDVEKAGQLLDRAGWRTINDGIRYRDSVPLAITLHTYPTRPNFRTLATAMQSQLQRVGFDVTVKLTDWATMMDAKENGEFDVTLEARTTFAYPPDPENLVTLYHSEESYMDTGYENEEVDKLLERGRKIRNRNERKRIYDRIQKIVMNDLPISYPSYITKVHGTRSTVQRFAPDDPVGNEFKLDGVSIEGNQ